MDPTCTPSVSALDHCKIMDPSCTPSVSALDHGNVCQRCDCDRLRIRDAVLHFLSQVLALGITLFMVYAVFVQRQDNYDGSSSLRPYKVQDRALKAQQLGGCNKPLKRKTWRVALLMAGDAFRSRSTQLEKGSCDKFSVDPQISAAKSHIELLIRSLERINYTVRVFGVTYNCSNGMNLSQTLLPSLYGSYMQGFSVIERSSYLYGGQVFAYRAAVRLALASIQNTKDAFEYYFVLRWDLQVIRSEPSFWTCALDNKPFVRNYASFFNWTSNGGMGRINDDWVLMIPAQVVNCFLALPAETCCNHRCMGSSCAFCPEDVNAEIYPETRSVCRQRDAPHCEVPVPCQTFRGVKAGFQLMKRTAPGPWPTLSCKGFNEPNFSGYDPAWEAVVYASKKNKRPRILTRRERKTEEYIYTWTAEDVSSLDSS